ncbi:MAG TPA: hypothetical protein VFU86_00715 [Terriglobales bacterium]|nr:hypothetical protein [Terriglobales bacterium]
MKPKVWIWTGVLAFLGYAIGGKSAIENITSESFGALIGGAVGFLIGWSLQHYDERRKRSRL